MRLLVIGGSGFLGRELTRQSLANGDQVAATHRTAPADPAGASWHRTDIRDRAQIADLIATVRPDAIINAAYDKSDWDTTAHGPAHVAVAATAVGARLVHVSSDAVFSGAAPRYTETARPDPTSPYGAAKAAAETAIAAIAPAAVIARTSLIIGDAATPSIHERQVHALIKGETTGALFTDDIRCPVHVTDLAAALRELAASPHSGIHHTTGPDPMTRHELGVQIAHRDNLDPSRLHQARRADLTTPGPLAVHLDSTATQQVLHTHLRGARQFLRRD